MIEETIHGTTPEEQGSSDIVPALKPNKKAEKRRLKKLKQRLESDPLNAAQRYRALIDLLEQFMDIAELADRKTRFALVILGALNAVNLLLIGRSELIFGSPTELTGWIALYAGIYIALSLYLVVQAINTLKPRMSRIKNYAEQEAATENNAAEDAPRLRFVHNVVRLGLDEYYSKWHSASFAQVNRDVAALIRVNAMVIDAKYQTLSRLFSGLLVLVFLSAGLILMMVYMRIG